MIKSLYLNPIFDRDPVSGHRMTKYAPVMLGLTQHLSPRTQTKTKEVLLAIIRYLTEILSRGKG